MLNDEYSKILKKSCKSLSLLKSDQTYFRTTKLQNTFQFLAGQPCGIFASDPRKKQPKMNFFSNRLAARFREALLHLPSKIGPT